MSSQIFKTKIPNSILFSFLDEICIKTDKYYIFNNNAFKKGIFNETINQFFNTCSNYYHNSKRKYLERKVTYNSVTTVIRQICNHNGITYTSQIKYDRSEYNIVYNVYFNQDLN